VKKSGFLVGSKNLAAVGDRDSPARAPAAAPAIDNDFQE